MASRIKQDGRIGFLLRSMAERGGSMTTDHRGFPPSKIMHPSLRRNLVVRHRAGILKNRHNEWRLTPKGWNAIGLQAPVDKEISDGQG